MLVCSIGKRSCRTIVETVVYTDSHLYQSKAIEVFVEEDGGCSRSLVLIIILVHCETDFKSLFLVDSDGFKQNMQAENLRQLENENAFGV